MEYRDTMHAAQSPYVYDGDNCDQHRSRWVGSSDGDKDGDGEIGTTLSFYAPTFPPGTKITVEEPICPSCKEVPSLMNLPGQSGKWECGCDFDWHEWATAEFA